MTRLALSVLGLLAFAVAASSAEPGAWRDLLRSAGNTADDSERLRLLRALEARSDLDTTLRNELGHLLPVVEDWANGKARSETDDSRAAENGYLCRFITSRVQPRVWPGSS